MKGCEAIKDGLRTLSITSGSATRVVTGMWKN